MTFAHYRRIAGGLAGGQLDVLQFHVILDGPAQKDGAFGYTVYVEGLESIERLPDPMPLDGFPPHDPGVPV
jgi:hypothetical protein